jgi:hypothetical protein
VKSITIHGLDDDLAKMLQTRAKQEKLSLNRTIKKLLRESLGLRPRSEPAHSTFGEFSGTWNVKEATEFDRSVSEQRSIDPEQWQ